jgi:hypothetical protein
MDNFLIRCLHVVKKRRMALDRRSAFFYCKKETPQYKTLKFYKSGILRVFRS